MGRLSSGYKINKAGDNPAGMAISSKMKAQIDGLNQAEANSDDGQSVLRIADGALNEVSNMLQRIRELSVQAANGTNSYSDRQSIQDEIDQLTQEVDRISTDTEYNKKTLLDGSANTRVYVSGTHKDTTKFARSATRIDFSEEVLPGDYTITVDEVAKEATYTLDNLPEEPPRKSQFFVALRANFVVSLCVPLTYTRVFAEPSSNVFLLYSVSVEIRSTSCVS